MACPVVYHPSYQLYDFGPEHPFSPMRLELLWTLLAALGGPGDVITPEAATRDDLLTVHDAGLVAAVEAASAGAAAHDGGRYGLGTPDVPVFKGMDAAARALVGGTLTAARQITAGRASRVLQLGGGLHHAHRDHAAGFCIYNDLSVAIRHFTDAGLRVAYLDLDVHHGDGVQALHNDAADVLTLSFHQTGQTLYPGTGFIQELGEAGGRGYKLNVPLEPRTGDASYLEVFELVAPHVLAWFGPDVLVVQCGADAHFADPLADLLLSTHAYERLFRRVCALADAHAGGRVLFTLGGGYDFFAAVRVWALLWLVAQDRPVPVDLPAEWLSAWAPQGLRAGGKTLHDAPPAFVIPDEETIAQQNRDTARRLLNMAARCWY